MNCINVNYIFVCMYKHYMYLYCTCIGNVLYVHTYIHRQLILRSRCLWSNRKKWEFSNSCNRKRGIANRQNKNKMNLEKNRVFKCVFFVVAHAAAYAEWNLNYYISTYTYSISVYLCVLIGCLASAKRLANAYL